MNTKMQIKLLLGLIKNALAGFSITQKNLQLQLIVFYYKVEKIIVHLVVVNGIVS